MYICIAFFVFLRIQILTHQTKLIHFYTYLHIVYLMNALGASLEQKGSDGEEGRKITGRNIGTGEYFWARWKSSAVGTPWNIQE